MSKGVKAVLVKLRAAKIKVQIGIGGARLVLRKGSHQIEYFTRRDHWRWLTHEPGTFELPVVQNNGIDTAIAALEKCYGQFQGAPIHDRLSGTQTDNLHADAGIPCVDGATAPDAEVGAVTADRASTKIARTDSGPDF